MTVRILLVDDEPSLAGVMELYLRKFIEDFEIIPALNGRDAVEKVKELLELETPPDLTLMDLRMPAMNGIECTKILAKMGLRNIHILSAYVDAELLTEAQSVGAKGVLKKSEGFKANAIKVAEMVRVIRQPNPVA
jgi:CheY-like chemotaxis protein